MDTNKILRGEFSIEPTDEEIAYRNQFIVNRIGTFRGAAVIDAEIAKCKHTAATWQWGDNSVTVVDIRAK